MSDQKNCRFCEVPVDRVLPKVNNLTAQLLQYHYIDEFYFYFSKPINEILTESRSPEYASFREMLCEVSRPKLNFSFYNKKDCFAVLLNKSRSKKKPGPVALLKDDSCFQFISKNKARKKNIQKRGLDEADERRKYARRKAQLPLRDGNLLSGIQGFVDAEAYDSKLFDIYNPSFSSVKSTHEPAFKNLFYEKTMHTGFQEHSSIEIEEAGGPLVAKQPFQIPLLRLSGKQKKSFAKTDFSAGGSENGKHKSKPAGEPAKSKGYGNSDNQSTQFSITYNRSGKSRRKQVLEDSKRSGTAISVTSRTFGKLTTSPKLLKKKKQEGSIRADKRSTKKSKESDSKNRLVATNSLFNSRSWKLIKSWDKLVANQIKLASTAEHPKSRPEKKTKTEADAVEINSARGLHTSNDNIRTLASTGNKQSSSRKLIFSPRIASDRNPLSREKKSNIPFASFRDKCSLKENKICLMKRLHKPLWINAGNKEKERTKSKQFSKDKTLTKSKTKIELSRGYSKDRDILQLDNFMLSENHFLTSRTKHKGKSLAKTAEKREDSLNILRITPQLADTKGYIIQNLHNKRAKKEHMSIEKNRPSSREAKPIGQRHNSKTINTNKH